MEEPIHNGDLLSQCGDKPGIKLNAAYQWHESTTLEHIYPINIEWTSKWHCIGHANP